MKSRLERAEEEGREEDEGERIGVSRRYRAFATLRTSRDRSKCGVAASLVGVLRRPFPFCLHDVHRPSSRGARRLS